ncbi:MAG: carboxypeptidase regulatory-like domain-containing protein [Myxococcales bacterium]|nr:carboxypeptidase regulatory-like domain-containing protein [Myxococcales bacterium]MCB9576708.1 carboxypeptidase regulatory-like domain-containing protein [Polyangiaceae bacterium]
MPRTAPTFGSAVRWGGLGLLSLGLLLGPNSARAAPKLRVRGESSLSARVIPRTTGTEVRGVLKDDSGRPIGQAHVRATLRAAAGARSLPPPQACQTTERRQLHASADEVVVDTDGAGSFCFLLPEPGLTGKLQVHFEGDPLYGRSEVELDIDGSRRSLSLRFSPEPRVLSLDRAEQSVCVETRVEPPLDSSDEVTPIQLQLTMVERGGSSHVLTRSTITPGERAELRVKATDLGAPGPATLSVQFTGTHALQPAEARASIQRTVRVVLSLAGPVTADSDGATLNVAAGSTLGAVPGGAIEIVAGESSLGTAPVTEGAARWTGLIEAPRRSEVSVGVRYLPDAPWYLPGEPLAVAVPVTPPSPWRALPWVIAVMVVTAWVIRGWLRPGRRQARMGSEAPPPSGRPSLEVIAAGPARSGWRGRVADAHDGNPIPEARITIRVPSFGGDGIAASVTTDRTGRFELGHVDSVEGAQLEVWARWHATLVRPLPPAGEMGIALISRRRALLARLVDWAKEMGPPWSGRDEPTPGHVRRVAGRRHAAEVQGWAKGVEAAAYGPEPLDEQREREVDQQEPPRVKNIEPDRHDPARRR